MRAFKTAFFGALLLTATGAHANCMDSGEGSGWKAAYPALYTKLLTYFSCEQDADPSACNVFVGRAAEGIYNVTDFKQPNGTYMPADTIMDFVHTSPIWQKIGMADDQTALTTAAQKASDHLVIAVMSDQPHGHVALVLPGDTQVSVSWNNLNVPNSASAFLGKPDNAYVFCKLSWSFADPSDVELWTRTLP